MEKMVQLWRNSDSEALSKRIAGYLYWRTIRKLLPTIAEVKYLGIPISRERKFGDAKIPVFLIPHPLENIAGYEQTLIGALQSEIRVGDRVTVVGGEGVTAVVAAQAVGETGSVVCFEGSGWGVRKVKATGIRNKMSRRLTAKRALVGEADQRLRRSGPACDARSCPGGTARKQHGQRVGRI
jgi:hypothetical protein